MLPSSPGSPGNFWDPDRQVRQGTQARTLLISAGYLTFSTYPVGTECSIAKPRANPGAAVLVDDTWGMWRQRIERQTGLFLPSSAENRTDEGDRRCSAETLIQYLIAARVVPCLTCSTRWRTRTRNEPVTNNASRPVSTSLDSRTNDRPPSQRFTLSPWYIPARFRVSRSYQLPRFDLRSRDGPVGIA